jgi:hypothetical protein
VAFKGTSTSQSAREILLDTVNVVIGRDTDVARYLARAINSDDPLDILLAQAAFDEMEGHLKRAVAREVESRKRAYGRNMHSHRLSAA